MITTCPCGGGLLSWGKALCSDASNSGDAQKSSVADEKQIKSASTQRDPSVGKTHTDPSASDYLRLVGSEDAETGPRGVQAIFQGDAETGPRGVWIKWKDHTKKQNRRVPDDEPGKEFVDIEMRHLLGKWHKEHKGETAPEADQKEGDALALLFRLLLFHFEQSGLIKKMTNPPKTSVDPIAFHRQYWIKFRPKPPNPSWLEMDKTQQTEHLRHFILEKFSLDPEKKIMIPEKVKGEEGYEEQQKMKRSGLLKKRCDACWTGFQLENMDSLVKEVMKDYVVYWNLS